MSRKKSTILRLTAIGTAMLLLLAACGSKKKEATTSTEPTKTVKIALIAPLSGSLSALGLGMKNAVDLAVNKANTAKKVAGWKIVFDPEDDTATANIGAQVAARVASDAAVVGVVGTLNSSVAQQVQPILDRANITMISPANTGVRPDRPRQPRRPEAAVPLVLPGRHDR